MPTLTTDRPTAPARPANTVANDIEPTRHWSTYLRSRWSQSVRESGLIVVALGGASVSMLGMTLGAALASGIPLSAVVRDPGVSLAQGPLVGVISVLGVLMWTSAAAVTIMAASLVTGRDRSFLLAIGLLSAWFAIDDQFMLHDSPLLESIPGGKQAYAVAYGTLVLVLAARLGRSIPGRHDSILALAVTLLGMSVLADLISDTLGFHGLGQLIIEDSLKFTGICYWATFAALRARVLVLRHRRLSGIVAEPAWRGPDPSPSTL
jgi:hypothetical protein